MSHIIIDGNCIIDWETGDPEGDRKRWLQEMRKFLNEVYSVCERNQDETSLEINNIFVKYKVHNVNIGDYPRINIDKPKE